MAMSAAQAFVREATQGRLDIVRMMWHSRHVRDVDCRNGAGWTALLAAVGSGHVAVAQFLLEQGASTESRTHQSLTPLHVAVMHGNVELVELLCRSRADVNAHDMDGFTALQLAQSKRFSHIALYLLDHGASAEAVDDNGCTVLVHACDAGNKEFVVQLVTKLTETGATDVWRRLVNQPRKSNHATPLHVAAARGNLSCVVLLVYHGAQLETKEKKDGFSPLSTAVDKGHDEVVEFLLRCGADVETTDLGRRTPLVIAAKRDLGTIVDMLLARSANIDHQDDNGFSALLAAAQDGRTSMVETLLKRGANAEIRQKQGATPLGLAARNGHLDIVRLLLDKGADANCQTNDGWTPLAFAVLSGHVGICEVLLDHGASPEIRGKDSKAPIHIAAETGNVELVDLLCRCRADVDARGPLGETAFQIALDQNLTRVMSSLLHNGASPCTTNDDGDTVLLEACSAGEEAIAVRIVETLHEAGETVVKHQLVNHARASDSRTPLMVAAYRGNLALVKFLVHHGAELETKNVNGYSALHIATMEGHEEIVQFLLGCGADTETTQSQELTPLTFASMRGFASIVTMLLDHGAKVQHRNVDGISALQAAAMGGHRSIVEALLKHGAGTENRNNEGATPLLDASNNGHLKVVRLLIDHGADVNCQSYDHWTPLTRAALRGNTAVCKLLLKRGALITHQTTDGQQALHLAASRDRQDVVRVLLGAGADRSARNFHGLTASDVASTNGHFTCAQLLDQSTGATESEHDDEMWPRHAIHELYGLANSSEPQMKTLLPRDPLWYIERSSVSVTEPCPRLTTRLAQVSISMWSGSRVLLVEPAIAIAGEFDVRENTMQQLFRFQVSKLYPLRHPHVIRLYGACHRGKKPFLVMEHPQNGTLRSFVSANKHRTWAILRQVALGMQYLHERGIIHRKLVGDNILIGDDGLVKLSAFEVLTTHLFDESSYLWEAPEVAAGQKATFESDIYSLGMCIVETVSGKSPYASELAEERNVKELVTNGIPPTKPAEFSLRVWELVMQMIAPMAHKRLKISEVVRELSALAHDFREIELSAVDCDETLESSSVVVTSFDAANASDNDCAVNDMFALAFSLVRRGGTSGNRENEEPHVLALERLNAIWQASDARQLVLPWVHNILSRFTNDLHAIVDQATSFAAQRQRADRVYAFHNEIDRLLDQHGELLAIAPTMLWRDRWHEHRRRQLVELGESLEHVGDLDVETATCLLFELTRRRDAYTSISPAVIHVACCMLRSMPGVRLPDWFIPHYEVAFDAYHKFSYGAFGSAHRGKWMGSRVVIKKINRVLTDGEAEFEKEVEIWSQLYHPHVLQLFGACHVGQKLLFSEYAKHGRLDKYLATRKREVWRTLHEAALGLQYLHSRGIVHCDLKCDNILVGRDGKAKVSDYGLSRKQQQQRPHAEPAGPGGSSGVGAPQWKAPEVLNGRNPTIESDVYSFGMCVVEAVTGEIPWMGNKDEPVCDHVRRGGALFEKPKEFTDEQWALVVGACRFDPVERLSLAEIISLLEAFAEQAKETECDATSNELIGQTEPTPATKDETSYTESW